MGVSLHKIPADLGNRFRLNEIEFHFYHAENKGLMLTFGSLLL